MSDTALSTNAILYGQLAARAGAHSKQELPYWWPHNGVEPSLLRKAKLFEDCQGWSGSSGNWAVRASALLPEWSPAGILTPDKLRQYQRAHSEYKDKVLAKLSSSQSSNQNNQLVTVVDISWECELGDLYKDHHVRVNKDIEDYDPAENPGLNLLANTHQMAAIQTLAEDGGEPAEWRWLCLFDKADTLEYQQLVYVAANGDLLGCVDLESAVDIDC